MATLSTTHIWEGLRHPIRKLQSHRTQSSQRTTSPVAAVADEHGRDAAERLERIATYARSGYFHMDYTAGMFVVLPLDRGLE
ncbi:hypothetical protein [Paraburkholderia sp. BCC1886]|uniref:hypothetical protein n=1 Tax=Paraburkholderia sp. BCC1886 TaxID=2562670 RepID=UPI00118350F0|nr:hypothetical protein [Paraburkholderia sp. BCC1886]